MNWLKNMYDKLEDSVNPIVVKELRQALQGKFITGTYLVFLAAMVLVLGFMIFSDLERIGNSATGKDIFQVIFYLLIFGCTFIIPIGTYRRLSSELSETDMALYFVTTLKPQSIIIGKWMASWIIALVLYTSAMPFLCFTYILKGIDLPTIFFLLILGLILVSVAILVSIFAACLPMVPSIKRIFDGIGGIFLVYAVIGCIAIFDDLIRSGVVNRISHFEGLMGLLTGLFALFTFSRIIYLFSVALISPPASNRSFTLRKNITVLWFISFIITWVWTYHSTSDLLMVWFVIICICITPTLPFIISERETWSNRIRKTIPANPVKRFFSYIFYSGWAGGFLWILMLFILTNLAVFLFGYFDSRLSFKSQHLLDTKNVFQGWVFFMIAYSLTANLVRTTIFDSHFPRKTTWVFFLVLLFILSVFPTALGFMIFGRSINELTFLNPFMISDYKFKEEVYIVGACWAAGAFLLSLPMIYRNYKSFKPL
ncbi:MAG: hypothetical protein HQM10_18240 [Candidatus Riflebacteria bacterium]|nr:hypothetical protein [Candidatus Riflebacteria bacterium]